MSSRRDGFLAWATLGRRGWIDEVVPSWGGRIFRSGGLDVLVTLCVCGWEHVGYEARH